MKCPKCGETDPYFVKSYSTPGYGIYRCSKCHIVFTDWQQSRIEELERQLKITLGELMGYTKLEQELMEKNKELEARLKGE